MFHYKLGFLPTVFFTLTLLVQLESKDFLVFLKKSTPYFVVTLHSCKVTFYNLHGIFLIVTCCFSPFVILGKWCFCLPEIRKIDHILNIPTCKAKYRTVGRMDEGLSLLKPKRQTWWLKAILLFFVFFVWAFCWRKGIVHIFVESNLWANNGWKSCNFATKGNTVLPWLVLTVLTVSVEMWVQEKVRQPPYLIFVTGATGGARVNFFWPV